MNIFTTSFTESTGDGPRSSERDSNRHRQRSTIDIEYRFGTDGGFTTPADIPGDDEESALATPPFQKAQSSSFTEVCLPDPWK